MLTIRYKYGAVGKLKTLMGPYVGNWGKNLPGKILASVNSLKEEKNIMWLITCLVYNNSCKDIQRQKGILVMNSFLCLGVENWGVNLSWTGTRGVVL